MPKGYTTAGLVQREMGALADDLYATDFDQVIGEVESYIDRYTGRSWLPASPIVDELHTIRGPYLYLDQKPVSAISAFRVRPGAVGATETTLTAGTDYELIDTANGIVLLTAAYPFGFDVVVNTTEFAEYIAKVSYTVSAPVPADVQRAATMLSIAWLMPRTGGDTTSAQQAIAAGIKSFAVGQDLSVTFNTSGSVVPAASQMVTDILKHYRKTVLV